VLPGLILRVNFGGRKVWRVARRKEGKSGKSFESAAPLGRYPIRGLVEAREAARRVLLADPNAPAKATFAEVMDNFLEQHVKAKGLRTGRFIEWALRHYIPADWRQRTFASIHRSDVTALMDGMKSARQADLVLSYLRSMMDFYAPRDDRYIIPIVRGQRGMGRYKAADHERARVLSDDEIRALWKITADLGPFGSLCRVLLLTAQRLGTVLAMRWADVVDGKWAIPELPRAKGTGGVLVLPKLAREIIDAQPRIRGHEDRVFPIGGFVDRKRRLDQRLRVELGGLEPWVLHDLRRTARSLMGRVKVPRDDAERVLGHRVGSKQERIYDRNPYQAEKQQALARLAAEVSRIVGQGPGKAAHASGIFACTAFAGGPGGPFPAQKADFLQTVEAVAWHRARRYGNIAAVHKGQLPVRWCRDTGRTGESELRGLQGNAS
jgi:integrase